MPLNTYDCDYGNKAGSAGGNRALIAGGGDDHPDGQIGALHTAYAASTGIWYVGACLKTTYDCDWQTDLLRDQWKVVAVGGTNRTQAVEINGSFRLGGWHPGTTEWYGGACLSY